MKTIFRLAMKNLSGAGLRTWLNVIVLSFSFLVIIWHKGLLNGWDRQAKTDMINWETGSGQLWHPGYDPYDPFTLTDAHSVVPPELKEAVVSGEAAPVLITQGTIYPGGRLRSILIKGIDPVQKTINIPGSMLLQDYQELPALIGSKMASDNKLKVGNIMMLRWRDKHGAFDATEAKIAGIFDTSVPTVDAGQIWVPLENLRKMTGLENEATLIILGKSETGLSTPEGWILKSKTELLKPVTDIIKMKSVSGSVLYIILLCLAMLAIFDTQVLSIFRRQKEIGTFIALGMTRSQVIGLFTLEGSLNSVFAAALAAIYGIPLLALQASRGLAFGSQGKSFGIVVADKIYPYYSAGLVAGTILIILITTTIVSYLPSRRIARMKPTEALRGKLQ
jgi:putative ABC transport system permease protein